MIPIGQRAVVRAAFWLLPVFVAIIPPAAAQIIPIRTVPLAQGDQFFIFPSNNFGMGGVSIALSDSLLDPFRNPALGARVATVRLFSSPTVYSISRQSGGGRTLPLAVLGRGGRWFGGLSVAVQQVEGSGPLNPQPVFELPRGSPVPIPQGIPGTADRTHGNTYAFASLGRDLGRGLSLGGNVLMSRLHGLDGIDLLYPGSQGLAQSGRRLDLRIGLLKQWSGSRSLEALILHDRFSMTSDVTYLDLFWDPGTQQFVQTPRVEHNLDRARTSGLHLAYQRPLTASGWRIGWIGTFNYVSTPRIAPSEVVTIPRDQGHSAAYNLGMGFSKTRGPATFGIDAIYEPIWSTSWAVADVPLITDLGDTIPAGGRTMVNRFRFSNVVLRLGVSRDVALADMQQGVGLELGLSLRSVHYRLTQTDRLAATEQPFRNGWVEWSPSWGLSLRFPELELRYRGRVTNGAGRPNVFGFFGGPEPLTARAPDSFLLPPSSVLDLAGVTTMTHQISLSLPLP
ncbi:MAG: hypothetical protein ACREMW_14250 [Gemmatimonadales bacterium]